MPKRHVALKASDDAKGVSKVPNLLWSDGAFDAFTRCLIFRVFACVNCKACDFLQHSFLKAPLSE